MLALQTHQESWIQAGMPAVIPMQCHAFSFHGAPASLTLGVPCRFAVRPVLNSFCFCMSLVLPFDLWFTLPLQPPSLSVPSFSFFLFLLFFLLCFLPPSLAVTWGNGIMGSPGWPAACWGASRNSSGNQQAGGFRAGTSGGQGWGGGGAAKLLFEPLSFPLVSSYASLGLLFTSCLCQAPDIAPRHLGTLYIWSLPHYCQCSLRSLLAPEGGVKITTVLP